MRRRLSRVTVSVISMVLAAGLLIILVGPAAHWLASYDKGSQPTAEQIDAARGRLFQVSTAVLALGALWYTARNHAISQENNRLSLDQYRLAERGQITERFAQAIEQLGSPNMDVRLGTIYILERIASDSVDDHPAVMEILCSFVCRKTSEAGEKTGGNAEPIQPPDLDIQAALTVIARRDSTRDHAPIGLKGAKIPGAQLQGAHLQHADLRFTDLREAHLHGADLRGAFFAKANLSGTYLHGADVSHADLRWAMMEHVWANGTDFRCAIFWGADLRQADLHKADLRDADLSSKEVSVVTPPGSQYSMSHLQGPYPAGWEVSSHYFPSVKLDQAILLGAQLEGANLQGVEGLTRRQVNAAANYTEQSLPDYLQ